MLLNSLSPWATLSDLLCMYFHKKIKIKSVRIISSDRKTTAEALSYCTCARVNTGITSINKKNTNEVNITMSSGTVRRSSIFIYSIQNTKITKKLDTMPYSVS